MAEQDGSKHDVYRDILGSIWPAFSICAALAGGTYFLVIEPVQKKTAELESRLDKLDARITAVEREQLIRTGTVARFADYKVETERNIAEIRASVAILAEKLADMRATARKP